MKDEINIPSDTGSAIKRGLAVLLLGFGGFVVWAGFAPLDEGVPLFGTVVVESQRKPIQHLNGGVVAKVWVKDGQHVKEGDVLLSLDVAIQSGQREILESQQQGLMAQLSGLNQMIPQRRSQVASLSQEVTALRPLVEEQLYPRNRYADLQRQLSQLRSQLNSDESNLQQAQAQLSEAQQRMSVLETEINRAELRATASGVVLGLKVNTPGSVIAAGDVIMEIVPDGGGLIIDASVPPHLIEQVREGLPAQLRFSALDQRKTPVIDGRVDRISADLVTDRDGNSFFQAKVSASDQEIERLGAVSLHPGMPVEVIVVTGERTFMNYLVKPMTDNFARALKER